MQQPSAAAPILRIESIDKTYPEGTRALASVDLDVNAGEIVCVLGPSGCGKTTLLRVVAGLEIPNRGRILFEGRDLNHVPTHRRGFGFMFQDFALFPHRTVAENVAFGLQMAHIPRAAQQARVAEMLELVNLPGYGNRTIFELSGGERQRVALARSLAPRPSLIMLDEPLGSLDRGLREELVGELRKILNEMEVTALYVTHDQDEAMALGDRMVIMQRGRIEQIGTPNEVYTHPATPFVARFLGFTNLLPARPAPAGVATPFGHFPKEAAHGSAEQTLLLRPEAARVAPTRSTVGEGFHAWGEDGEMVLLNGTLLATGYHGSHYRVEVNVTPQAGNATSVPTMHFQLPAYQRMGSDELLHPVQLPPKGQAISLLIYTDLATLLPYPSQAD